jgi:hypothetical protein
MWGIAMAGQVIELLTSERAGAPMQSHRQVLVRAGAGIEGDRYVAGSGHWSDPRWPDQELTLVMAEVAERLAIAPRLLRRNVVTRGVELDGLIGVTFQIGDVVLSGVRRCDPCQYLAQFTRVDIPRALGQRGGLRAHVVSGRRMRVGDRIVALPSAVDEAPAEPTRSS